MIQEATPLRTSMGLNLGESLLGGVYNLYVDALGSTVAWWLGHLTIVATIALMYWVVTNWNDVSSGMDITGTRVSAWLTILALTVGQYVLYSNYFGFPPVGAFLTALGTSAYLWWQWYQLEPQKA